jgi:ASC-1-like (ASCH) protein
MNMHHIAIMRTSWGLTPKIQAGQKTIESRWYKNRAAPWDKIRAGDTVFFKDAGKPVTLQAAVAKVLQLDDLTPMRVQTLLETYGPADGLTPADLPQYYERFKDKRYCLLIFLTEVRAVAPFYITKARFGAMASWITTPSVQRLRID